MKQGSFNKLEKIFGKDNKIIIPDLQRDYCWGNPVGKSSNKSLADIFSSELVKEAQKDLDYKEFSYGIIYCYQYPKSFLYLCDGQQRLTTLYLIIGVLNCYYPNKKFNTLLQTADGLPRLKYEVRHTTDYFIRNLVDEVFLKSDVNNLNKIITTPWFRDEYMHDPSIKSIKDAIISISQNIRGQKYDKIADFIMNKIGFVYINLEADDALEQKKFIKIREYGEKMYELVNTCGDPMEFNEHKKSSLLSSLPIEKRKEWTEKWEIWQDFFWIHKGEQFSADKGFNEFLVWITKINGFHLDIITIEKYFKAFFIIITIQDKLVNFRKFAIVNLKTQFLKNQQPSSSVLYSALEYLHLSDLVSFDGKNYSLNEGDIDFDVLFRFVRFFSNLSKNFFVEKEILKISRLIKYPQDICAINLLENESLIKSFGDEEFLKLNIYKLQTNDIERKKVEDTLWLAEDHNYLNGRLAPFFKLMEFDLTKNYEIFSLDAFKVFYQKFDLLVSIESNLEKVRMVMLTKSFDAFHEGWSWNSKRYYLGISTDFTFWRKHISSDAFLNVLKNLNDDVTLDSILTNEIDSITNSNNKTIVKTLATKASDYWQWNNNKRFFIFHNEIRIPNGVQAKDNTDTLKYLVDTENHNVQNN